MMRLHGFAMSPNTRRAQLALEEAGLPYELVPVDLMTGEQRKPEYAGLNPTMRVPTLLDGDYKLWESNAIIEYIAARAPESGLAPRDARERAEVSRWMFMNAAHLSPAQAHIFAHTMRLPEGERIAKLVENGRAEVDRCLGPLNTYLDGREFILDRITIADLAIAASLAFSPMLGIDLSKYPNVQSWLERMRARPAFKKVYG
jgi:glutathione S-transferase